MHGTLRFIFSGLIILVVTAGIYAGLAHAQGAGATIPAELSPWLAAPIITAFTLIAVGLLLMTAEALMPGVGILGFVGIVAFMSGGLFLAGSELDGAKSSWPFFVGLGIASVGLLVLTFFVARKIRGRPVVTGYEQMVGEQGVVTSIDAKTVYAHVRGEKWHVISDVPLSVGQTIRVQAVSGLTLKVVPVTDPDVT